MLPNGEYRQNIADIVLNRINEIQSWFVYRSFLHVYYVFVCILYIFYYKKL